MIFNFSTIIGLSLSSISTHSPLFASPPNAFSASYVFKNLNLNKFVSQAFFDSSLSNLTFYKSNFEHFLERPISIQQDECTVYKDLTINYHIDAKCFNATYCTFLSVKSNLTGGALSISWEDDVLTYIDHCSFLYCSAKKAGGAIYTGINRIKNGQLITSSCLFSYCTIENTFNLDPVRGGAIYCRANIFDAFNSTFRFCGVKSNVGHCYGGAIYAEISNAEKAFSFSVFYNCYVSLLPPPPTNMQLFISKKSTNETKKSFSHLFIQAESDASAVEDSCGGAIYLCMEDGNPKIEFYCTNFTNCSASEGSSLYSSKRVNLHITGSHFSNGFVHTNSVVYLKDDGIASSLFVHTMGITTVDCNFIFYSPTNLIFENNNYNSGQIFHDKFDVNNSFSHPPYNFNGLNYLQYADMPIITIPPFLDSPSMPTQDPTISATESETPTPLASISQSPNPTESIIFASDEDSMAESLEQSESGGAGGDSGSTSTGQTKKGGLSTIAIVFIVLACIIFVVGVIITVYLLCRSHFGHGNESLTNVFGRKSVDYF